MLVELMLALLQPVTPAPTAPAAPKAQEAKPAMHPVITEVLYAVPKEGDADQDGKRSATGDEFIELINPHDKAINLKGYTITDGKPAKASPASPAPSAPGDKNKKDKGPDDSRVRFTFPDLTLQPGEVVVVFNGYESHTPGPVGDSKAPASKNDKFHNAYVLSMHVKSQYIALANNGDCALLCDPDGKAVEGVYWGESDKKPETPPPSMHKLPESKGSVQRSSITGEFIRHQDLPGDFNGKPFSPGEFELPKKK